MKQPFSTQEACILYFEKLRWRNKVICPYCFSEKTHKAKNEIGRHFCYDCVKSFSVLVGTIFEDTRLDLPTWIAIIKAMLKSKNSITAQTISSNFGITVKTAWLTAMKIRCAMVDKETSLHGLFTIDKKYIHKKHKSKKLDKYFSVAETKNARVKRLNASGGLNDSAEQITVNLVGLLKHYIKQEKNQVVTMRSYGTMDKAIEQISLQYAELYKDNGKQTLRGDDWAVIKKAIYQENKTLSPKYLPFYFLEYEYKCKRRGEKYLFPEFIKGIFSEYSKAIMMKNTIIKKQFAYAEIVHL